MTDLQRQIARDIAVELLRKSGVREWHDTDAMEALAWTANEIAYAIYNGSLPPFPGPITVATSKLLVPEYDGTPIQIIFNSSSGNAITAANDLRITSPTPTYGVITLASLANSSSESTGARQSAKIDFGTLRAPAYRVAACFELAATPTAGNVIELWWAPSQSATAGNGNPGAASGSDASYTGYSSNISASLKQLIRIGDFVCTAQATTTKQVSRSCGVLVPPQHSGSLVVFNKSGAAFHSSDVECHITLTPLYEQGQAA